MAAMPSAAVSRMTSTGKWLFSSHSDALGAMRSLANVSAVSWMAACSSVRAKCMSDQVQSFRFSFRGDAPPRLAHSPQRLGALTRHQLVGALPARQRAHALRPGVNARMRLGPVVAVLLDRVVHVPRDGEIGDGGPVAGDECPV